ncbi:M23 family metallopeptidase [uncultured Helicobacter sp.]|uniref:M23 family metallopeptidase n=1 Tax=uncultured Helicobacter sp. TaxID=175537 RepID=UPI00374F7F66
MRNLIIAIVVVCLGAIMYLVFNFFVFERQKPVFQSHSSLPTHWNLQDDLSLHFSDASGIRSYSVEVLLDSQILFSQNEVVLNKPKTFALSLPKPLTELKDGTTLLYKVCVNDWSNTNFFAGNTTCVDVSLVIDTSAPQIEILARSPKISRSGSAFVLFKVKDIALDSVTLSNGKNEFRAFKHTFKDITLAPDEAVYGAFIAWPLENVLFEGSIRAVDKAANKSQILLHFPKNLNAPIRKSNIRLKPEFLESKLRSLLDQISDVRYDEFADDRERFLFINEQARSKDSNQILEATTTTISNKSYISFGISPFAALKNAIIVGYFGDERSYYLDKNLVSVAYHMGLDLASVRNAPIFASNGGVVILRQYLGLHGNTAVIYHGFGLSSLYAHMSDSMLKVGDEVKSGDIIGYTGSSGWAFGDHLHLEILVQGHAVSVQEWTNPKWVEDNINAVFEQAHRRLLERVSF